MSSCLIIAGEKSGEDHALSFVPELMMKYPDYNFWGVGGDEMESLGVDLVFHLKDFSSWGFSEVIVKIPFYKKALKKIEEETDIRECRVAILIDFQGFNLRLAKRLHKKGVKILYYVAPQAWAWKARRTKTLRECVHTLFTIIPFEKEWFRKRGVRQVVSVSHPLWMTYKNSFEKSSSRLKEKNFSWLKQKPRLLLLPGSRDFEVKNLLPLFIKAAKELEMSCELGLVKSSNVNERLYTPYLDGIDNVYDDNELETALTWSGVAMAASGTVTLTCALFEVPTVVAYKTSLLNEFIFYNCLNYDGHITLANIVHDQEVFPELVQNRASVYNLVKEMNRLLNDEKRYCAMKEQLSHTRVLIRGDHDESLIYMMKAFEC